MRKYDYTLYFKGINKYGHEHTMKLVSLYLRSLDEYTANYKNFKELYSSLDDEIKYFIENELSHNIDLENNEELSGCFFVTDEDFSPIMDVIFYEDIDALYITLDELTKLLVNNKMTFEEYQKILYKNHISNEAKSKYEFFKYLYETYVSNQKVICMIDVYETSKKFPNLKANDLILASIATDKDNIMVLCKKLGQLLESRRNLALKYKKLYTVINENNKILELKNINERKKINLDIIKSKQKSNFYEFKKEYDKEYR